MIESLKEEVEDDISVGSRQCSLGICNMPDGYALMINPDRTHYYWLRSDGAESFICWDKWAVYRGAKANKIQNEKDEKAATTSSS